MPQPEITISTTRTRLGPAHHVAFTIPNGHCEPAEFVAAAHQALAGFTARSGFGVLLDGRGPVWGYGMLIERTRPAAWIGIRDPRLGIVVMASQTAGVTVGEVYAWADISERGAVVAVCGPPHSGKSVFLATLYRALLLRRPSQFVFLQRACPDGEGMWSAESSPEVAQTLRAKGRFTPEFTAAMLRDLDSLASAFPLVLVDMPGRRDAIAEALLDHASHALILSRSTEESTAWRELAQARGCELLAVIDSRRTSEGDDVRSRLDLSATPPCGQLVDLERDGSAEPYQVAINELADWLVLQSSSLTPRSAPASDPV